MNIEDFKSPQHWLQDTNTNNIRVFVNYVLWDSSTEFMVTHGMPTNEDVEMWIAVLESRLMVDENIQAAIADCKEYIKPYVPPQQSTPKDRPRVEVGKVYKVKKVS